MGYAGAGVGVGAVSSVKACSFSANAVSSTRSGVMDVCILLLTIAGVAATVEVHFENRGGGFFVKHSPRTLWSSTVADLGKGRAATAPSPPGGSTVLSVDRFTVFVTSQPVSVRATYGPFSTKQTVPARSLVPVDEPPVADARNFSAHGLDVSAHLVRPDVPRDAPVLRVLFHTGGEPSARRRLCILLHASMAGRAPLSAACTPDGEDGVCLAQLTIPASWWPPLPPPDKAAKPPKTPQRLVQVAYSVLEPRGEKCVPRVQIQPVTPLASAPLVAARANYREVRADDVLSILLPHAPLYPLSHVHVPVFLLPPAPTALSAPITAFVLRGRVKSGLRILSVDGSSDKWNVTAEVNGKHKSATVTCVRKDTPDTGDEPPPPNIAELVMTWLVEVVEDGEELWDGGRVVWTAHYYTHHQHHTKHHPQTTTHKLSARLEIQKDDIQSVLPIAKNWEVMNTAVLTGHQVSQAMKVLIVSQAGKVGDVTLQSSCHSEDESVLKVSSSCSSVYVDGSELRGSSNASVLVKYGTYTGLAEFLVWMPEFPLELNLPDVRLSQVKGWRVPDPEPDPDPAVTHPKSVWGMEDNLMDSDHHPSCRLRFQQTPIEVYARFLAEDHESGRVSYFGNRRTWLRVTDLVLGLLRVADPRIASLHGRVVQGKTIGRTEVQVLSPITGRVIGAKEVRCGNDKVSVVRLAVQVVSGLQLSISPDTSIQNGYIAETSVTRKLTAQYQEGLLDIEMEWSDGTRTALRQVPLTDYQLLVDSSAPDTVAFAPMVASHHPRVIAVGEGRGKLLRVAVVAPSQCRRPPSATPPAPLAETMAEVEVDFGAGAGAGEVPQNDGHGQPGRERHIKSDLADILRINGMTPLKDENNHEPTVQARQLHGVGSRHRTPAAMTPLEIGMYVLLAAFCFAIVVFVVSCVVYASKFKPQLPPPPPDLDLDNRVEGCTDARDWVWLGRATLDRSHTHTAGEIRPARPVHITDNPLNPHTVDNPLHLPTVDTSTFCKSGSGRRVRLPQPFTEEEEEAPPPVPPHGKPQTQESAEPATAAPPASPATPARRHRHHHRPGKHDKVEKSDSLETGNVPTASAPSTPKKHHHHHNKNRSVRCTESVESSEFVQLPAAPSERATPVKRATTAIIATGCSATPPQHELQDLNLGMNYDQIMLYFDNLKESNA